MMGQERVKLYAGLRKEKLKLSHIRHLCSQAGLIPTTNTRSSSRYKGFDGRKQTLAYADQWGNLKRHSHKECKQLKSFLL